MRMTAATLRPHPAAAVRMGAAAAALPTTARRRRRRTARPAVGWTVAVVVDAAVDDAAVARMPRCL